MNNPLHSLFKPKFDVVEELKRLQGELNLIESLKSLSNSKGWGQLKRWVVDEVVRYDQSIVTLSSDIDRNRKEIEYKRQFRDALLWFIGRLDDKMKVEPEIKRRMEFLAETAHDLDPNDIEKSIVELQGDVDVR